MNKQRVLVGMSGGVDSSAVCLLLQEQGYEVVGATLHMWGSEEEPPFITDARQLATRLGIEHHIIDIRKEFREGVIASFIDEYMRGRTPNPCVMCNPNFKWKALLECAYKLGCTKIATGHYVNIIEENGKYFIEEGGDGTKDQSYFLWGLTQEQLSQTLFPLGRMIKSDVKQMMRERGFESSANKSESMEICFIEKDYRTFLRQNVEGIDEQYSGGFFVDKLGKRLGQHKGYPFYTIGQRKGLEIALGHPAYVIKINPLKNTVKLGKEEDLLSSILTLTDCKIVDETLLTSPNLVVRIRYRGTPYRVSSITQEENTLKVTLADAASAVAPGQSAVFYIGNRVIGGGILR
ncbi:MAG: tRNA 2-thiouridine(34) synthase MnmA [Bacteroidales bacterium]|nr:tRNA 2-thiouridine(34) synthase MnmA [Bacteroidales bacterium]